MIGNLREQLSRLPLRSILLFFVTLLIVAYYRRGYVIALWIVGWIAFIATKFAFAVKEKVDRQSGIKNQQL
jgi:hypothetical protein